MRESLFRGFDEQSNQWVYGVGVCKDGGDGNIEPRTWILVNFPYRKASIDNKVVNEKSVGEFTGLTDKNGVKIFEGDIVSNSGSKILYIVRFNSGCFEIKCQQNKNHRLFFCDLEANELQVIGNLHDNSELIGGAGK